MRDTPNSDHARLEMNARAYRYDPVLDPAADRLERDPLARNDMHPTLADHAAIHLDFRNQYRAAVKAGAIPDDRNAQTPQENQ